MIKKLQMTILLLLICSSCVFASAATVEFNGTELYQIEEGIGNFSPQERAAVVELRLQFLAEHAEMPLEARKVPYPGGVDLVVGDQVVFSITDHEAAALAHTSGDLADERWKIILQAISKYREARSEHGVLLRTAWFVAGSAAVYLIWRLLRIGQPKIERKLNELQSRILLLPKNLSGFWRRQTVRILLLLLKPLKLLLQAMLICGYLILLLKLFPASVPYAEKVLEALLTPIENMVVEIFEYLPNLVTVGLILLLSRYLLKFIHYIAGQVEAKEIVIDGFEAEWGKPTYNIIRFLLLALTLIAVFPYLPGAQSPVFQGISVFIGLLISLGSSSMVNNIFSGFVLIYTRAYRIGDYIMVGSHFGKVIDSSVLVTRLLTPKNETVTVPNSTMLGSNIINYSAMAAGDGVILHSEVTIGYDVPWRRVFELLLLAAAHTKDVLPAPQPFVLQTGLSDFYVKYELNVFTRRADNIPLLYSMLYQNIQDVFHEAGVEIMSPHYRAWRDGESAAIPKNMNLQKGDYDATRDDK